MSATDNISSFLSRVGLTAKSLVKLALSSRKCDIKPVAVGDERLIVMGNGPSLKKNIEENMNVLTSSPTMAVNFAGNADEFTRLRPDFYILADPHFFEGRGTDPNVDRLFSRLASEVDWDMTLFIPVGRDLHNLVGENSHIRIKQFNPVGVEGFKIVEDLAFRSGRGMPRPRNVLIPAIMVGMLLGFKEIFIVGADHTWTRTLEVDENNTVVSVQPHFYKDNSEEKARVTSVYRNVRLHDILLSMHLAFKSYHAIARYAGDTGVKIFNATPGSFIDAFQRKNI